MGTDMAGVDHDLVRRFTLCRQLLKDALPDAASRPLFDPGL
jgi:ribosomal protein S14